MPVDVETILKESIAHITGLKPGAVPLGGIQLEDGIHEIQNRIVRFVRGILGFEASTDPILTGIYNDLKDDFLKFYSQNSNRQFLKERWEIVETTTDDNLRARAITEIWAPETAMTDEDILSRWKLSNVCPNKTPYKPHEVVIQINGLYSLPKNVPDTLSKEIRDEWGRVKSRTDDVIYDYDHPVPLFSPDAEHELVSCLDELDKDIDFEKEQGVLLDDYQVPVVVSVSVTHPRIDRLCSMWLQEMMTRRHYKNMRFYLLNQQAVEEIKSILNFYPKERSVFSVLGKYANHFNTLKYFQLLMEKPHGIRAGFKIDADEGIRSRDLYAATGKTWFQTMCHKYWGGTANDPDDSSVYLGVNEGEYINEKDIHALGYKNSLRMPDVSFNGEYIGPQIFFNKAIAHARATALYNRKANRLEDFISHPVVKGGGYGIDNYSLKTCAPFTLSLVGRAEDQQFYLACLAKGINGIFHPDLRIAHYKQSIAVSESTTEVTRFIGDMFRLVIFKEIVGFLGVKIKIDPMPGVFAGDLARIQAFFSILYKSYGYLAAGEVDKGNLLFTRGLDELQELIKAIDSGEIKRKWKAEKEDFKQFIRSVAACSPDDLKRVVETLEIK